MSSGNISPFGFSFLSFLRRNVKRDWSFFLLFFIAFLASLCFAEPMCLRTVLFFLLRVSLHASHLSMLLLVTLRNSFLFSLTRCKARTRILLSANIFLSPASFLWIFLFLAIAAFSGSLISAPRAFATLIVSILESSLAESFELGYISLELTLAAILKTCTHGYR